jgi:hypothetical protein
MRSSGGQVPGYAVLAARWHSSFLAAAWPRKTTAQPMPVTAHTLTGPKNAPVAPAAASPTHRPYSSHSPRAAALAAQTTAMTISGPVAEREGMLPAGR